MAWSAKAHDNWSKEMGELAAGLSELLNSGERLLVQYVANNAGAHADYTDANGMTAAELTAMVVALGDLRSFISNEPVTQGDRKTVFAQALAGYRAERR